MLVLQPRKFPGQLRPGALDPDLLLKDAVVLAADHFIHPPKQRDGILVSLAAEEIAGYGGGGIEPVAQVAAGNPVVVPAFEDQGPRLAGPRPGAGENQEPSARIDLDLGGPKVGEGKLAVGRRW